MKLEKYETPLGTLTLVRHELFDPVDQDYEDAKELIREVAEVRWHD